MTLFSFSPSPVPVERHFFSEISVVDDVAYALMVYGPLPTPAAEDPVTDGTFTIRIAYDAYLGPAEPIWARLTARPLHLFPEGHLPYFLAGADWVLTRELINQDALCVLDRRSPCVLPDGEAGRLLRDELPGVMGRSGFFSAHEALFLHAAVRAA